MRTVISALLLMLGLQLSAAILGTAEKIEVGTPAWYQQQYKKMMGEISLTDSTYHRDVAASLDSLSKKALEKYPYNSIAHELRGHYYYYKAGFDDKGHAYKDSTDFEQDYLPVLTAGSKQNYEMARFHYIKALTYDDGNINARQRMLRVETAMREYTSALIYCNELLEVAPYDAGLWKRKIQLYRLMKNDAEADRLAQRYMTIYTDDIKFKQGEADRKLMAMKYQPDADGYLAKDKEKTLREMIALHPRKPEYYYYLVTYLAGVGKTEEALAEAGAAMTMCRSSRPDTVAAEGAKQGVFYHEGKPCIRVDRNWFIRHRAEMLCDLNRAQEAENFLLNLQKGEGLNVSALLTTVRKSMAESARMNDPYEAYAHAYSKNRDTESLRYLIRTALKRGYYEDALLYVKDMQKRDKDNKWQLAEYDVLKRLNYTSKANELQAKLLSTLPQDTTRYAPLSDFMQARMQEAKTLMADGDYRHAEEPLTLILRQRIEGVVKPTSGDNTFVDYQEAAWAHLYNCYFAQKQWVKAEAALDTLYQHYRKGQDMDKLLHRVDLSTAKGESGRALKDLYDYMQHHPSASDTLATTYEEIAIPHVKALIDSKLLVKADAAVDSALTVCPRNIDLLTYGVNIAQSLQDNRRVGRGTLRERVDSGYNRHPQNRFFRIKKAQLLQSDSLYREAIATITPLMDDYIGDSVIIGLYVDNTCLLVDTLMKENRRNRVTSDQYKVLLDSVRHVTDRASNLVPNTPRLMQAYGRYHTVMSKWDYKKTLAHRDSAYQAYRLCKSEFDSPAEYRQVTNQLYNDSRHNELSFEYQHGVSGEDVARTGTAYATYKHIFDRGDELTAGLAYAGRSGVVDINGVDANLTDYTKGGIGVQLTAGYSHNFGRRFTGEIQAAYSTHYFPKVTAKLGATWHLRSEWDLNFHASYRWISEYEGVYKKSVFGEGYEIDHWEKSDAHLLQAGVSASKMIRDHFRLEFGADAFMKGCHFYANGNIKMQYYPIEGSKNHFFVSGGMGTAPDGSLLDRAHSVAFNDINGFVSMGGYVLLTRNLGVGLSGTWNTIYVQSERPAMTMVPNIISGYNNYFYVNANVVIKF